MEKSMKAYEVRPVKPERNFESTIVNTPLPPMLWECVIKKGQTFIDEKDKMLYQVSEVRQPAVDRKWDADIVLTSLATYQLTSLNKSIRASALCSDPSYRRLPDLDLEESYLFDEELDTVPPSSSPTRIGLGPDKGRV